MFTRVMGVGTTTVFKYSTVFSEINFDLDFVLAEFWVSACSYKTLIPEVYLQQKTISAVRTRYINFDNSILCYLWVQPQKNLLYFLE